MSTGSEGHIDFSTLFNPAVIPDCRVIIGDEEIQAHGIILANCSTFFENAFTAHMAEQESLTVRTDFNPGNLLRRVIEWMYTGKLPLKTEEFIPALSIASFYVIPTLSGFVKNEMNRLLTPEKNKVNNTLLMNFIKQCYDENFLNELEPFVDFVVKNFSNIDMKQLSENVDVPFFADVMKKVVMDDSQKLSAIKHFLGSYDISEHPDEIELLDSTFSKPLKGNLMKKLLAVKLD